MISRLFAPRKPVKCAAGLYAAILAQSRLPVFYTAFGMADTVTGRFDLLTLHMLLFARRLAMQNDPGALRLSQAVFDCFTADLDDALRALGIGDTTVPKRKRAMVRGFYAQIEEFTAAMDAGDTAALAGKMAERFFPAANAAGATLLASYALRAIGVLSTQSLDQIAEGKLDWPQPLLEKANVQ